MLSSLCTGKEAGANKDKLHPNKKGYIRWTAGIKPILMAELGG
jgi:hypothetical protein